MSQTAPQLVPSVDRAVRMLQTLRQVEHGQGISALARALDIPKSSAHQIAATLLHHGLLERDAVTQRYRLAARLNALTAAGVGITDLPELAAPYLVELALAARMTAVLGRRVEDGFELTAKQESPDPIDVSAPLGYRLDTRAGVFGKLFAAALHGPALDAFLAQPLPAFTARSITRTDDYRADLHRVRERGFALDVEEYLDGIVAVGAAVRDQGGHMIGAICLIGVAAGYSREQLGRIGEAVRGAAEALSYDLGFTAARPTDQTIAAPRPVGSN